jgi:hypothetical protein
MKLNIKKRLLTLLAVPALVVSVSAAPVFAASDLSITEGVSSAKSEEQPTNLFGDGGVFQTITNVLLFIIGAISVIMLIIGGIRYVVSGGDQSAVTAAKSTILYAIVGIVVAFLAYAAVNFVVGSLGSAT